MNNEKDWLLQKEWRDLFFNRVGNEQWLTVRLSSRMGKEWPGIFCAFIPNDKVPTVLEHTNWDLSIGHGMPGCITYYADGDENTEYFRFGDDDGIEPLVIEREFHGMRPDYREISEEFRFFHNLCFDAKSNKYIKFSDRGDDEDSVIMEEDAVKVRLKHIRQFLAIKEMHFAIYFDVFRYSSNTLDELGMKETDESFNDALTRADFFVRKFDYSMDEEKISMSRLLGKRLIPGLPKEKSGFAPYEEEESDHADFVIGSDEYGDPVSYNCDHEALANYFGANPEAPHYLTPVFFRREVLNKYFAQPEKYSVEDNILTCGSLWSLRMDNNHEKYIIVYLGDLGRDLSYREQLYWKSFNVPPDGHISQTEFKRAFLAEFADPERADLKFKQRFRLFQERWFKKFGWHLFRPLTEKDEHLFTALRIPLTDDQSEFDSQVLALAKILADSLNDKEIQKRLSDKIADAKSISKLEAFLIQEGLADYQSHIKFLRNLFSLRSAGSGHRKGKDFEKAAAVFGFGERKPSEVLEEIFLQAELMLHTMDDHFLS